MTLRHASALASLTAATLLAACSQPAPPAAAPTPAPVAETPPEPMAPPATVAAVFDSKTFPGLFSGTLPCSDCVGTETSVEINADGTFHLTEAFEGRKENATNEFSGTWTAEDEGALLRLDPDSKAEPDRVFDISWPDVLTMHDDEGKPSGARRLVRKPATP